MIIQNLGEFDNSREDGLLSATVEMITPEKAKEYLLTQESNRDINDRRVADYLGRMNRGEWILGQPITFDEGGRLIDGQHRLKAVMRHGEPVAFTVIRGMPPESKSVFDIGQRRTTAQIAKFLGNTKSELSGRYTVLRNALMGSRLKAKTKTAEINRNAVNVIGATRGVRSPQADIELEKKYSEGLDFAMQFECFSTGRKAIGKDRLIQSVFFRAYYNVSHERLYRFMEVFYSGLAHEEGDYPALLLRNYIAEIKTNKRKVSAKDSGLMERYKKTESAVASFIAKRQISQLRGSEYEEFPLADFD